MKTSNNSPIYRRHRFPPEVIAYAVWLYFKFPLSLRMVEDLLAERGIIASHQRQETLALARRRPGWVRAGNSGPESTKRQSG